MGKMQSAVAGGMSGAAMGGVPGAIGGAALGFMAGSDDKSNDYYEQMLEAARGIPLPVLKEQHPELYAELAKYNPEMEQSVTLGPSSMEGIALDPAYKQAQMNALNKLMNITENNGQDAQFLADSNRLQNDVNSNLQGNTGAIQQNMATRGLSGGMSELVSKQMAAQQAANRQSQMGLDINAQAQQRALQSLMNQGQLGGQMSQQDFSQQSAKAQAADSINRFNAANLQNVNSSNVAARNQAQLQNNQNTQNIHNQNVDVKNKAADWNTNGISQQNYGNRMNQIGMSNDIMAKQAANSYNQSKDQDAFIGGVASSVAKYAGQKKLKKDEE